MASSSKVASWEQFYDGSRSFQFVAEAIEMPIDQVNFLLAQLFGVALSLVLRSLLPPASYLTPHLKHQTAYATPTQRHRFALVAGLALTYFCFGKQVLVALLMAVVCYSLLLLVPPSAVHRTTLLVCMGLLSVAHIYRQAMQQAAFVIDITGPMMMIVQRATCVAFGVHDGATRGGRQLTPMQEKNAITKVPSLLEYLSYLLSFQSILAGPFLLYRDYQDYIEGTDEFARAVVLEKSSVSTVRRPLNPGWTAARKLFLAALCAASTCLLAPMVPVHAVTEPWFSKLWFPHKVFLLIISTTLARNLYYTAWLLADAVCNMGGLGYSGTTDGGEHTWRGASNVDIWGVEFGTSLRVTLDSWNSKTMVWLRYTAYERLPPKYQVAGTYLLSSTWHGFYPGYYCTFCTASLVTLSARMVRRCVRPRVLAAAGGEERALMQVYHVITWFVARLLLSYCVYTFVLLRWWPSVMVYWELYFYIHVFSLLGAFVLPIVLPPPPKTVKESTS